MQLSYKNTAYRVSIITMFINLILSLFKLFAGIYGYSHAMISDAVHSMSDCASTIIQAINQIKYGAELQSYKTGSVSGVKTRIKLFTEGVSRILDGR